ncbi:hypothetical protein Tco_0057867 [Tanacetum coccineum]
MVITPEEDDDEDLEEDPADYPTDRDDDEEEEEPSGDEADDEDEDDEMSIRDQTPIPFPPAPKVDRFLAISTPPPSPLSLLSSPLPPILSPLPQILSQPLPISSPPLPASPTYPLGYRATMIRLRAETPSTSHPLLSSTPPSGTPPLLPILLPISSPPLLLPSTDCRAGVSEVTLPPWKRLCIALGLRYEVGKSSSTPTARPPGGFRADYGFVGTLNNEIRRDPKRYVGYGIIDTWDEMLDEMLVGMPGAPATDDTELGRRMTNFVTTRDRRSHAYTALLMEREARLSRKTWGRSMAASDTARSEVMALRTTMLGQQAEIAALRATDRTRQA